MPVPSKVPSFLTAGDTWLWTRELTEYPASTWDATVYFVGAGGVFNAPATADGDTHSFEVAAATTIGYDEGFYAWTLRVTDGSTVIAVEKGTVEVLPDPATASATDTRSWAQITLAAVEAFLSGNATTAQKSMQIRDRAISRWELRDLLEFRRALRAEVEAEEQAEDFGLGRNIKVRYVRP